jgi:pSer/pThr/pTyr-binding forkhead associated (FHA) protein
LEVDVPLDSGRVSRRHARLWREGDRIMLIDLGSSNGTLVDGVAAGTRPVELILPTVLTFGDAVYRLSTR